MMEVGDFPFVASLAHWIWGRCQSDQDINYTISPEICLNQIPFLSWHCLEPIITKFAGVGIIVGSCFNKAPTILNLFQARSAEGFSRFSVYSETLFYTNCSIYSILMKYPLTAVSIEIMDRTVGRRRPGNPVAHKRQPFLTLFSMVKIWLY